ncbi:MAG TPA: hypothetical protein VK753_07790, partial [Xanthomonadaceae bacterium]|nr:hypothetical protein [Xanthomonadaceae bacterium]
MGADFDQDESAQVYAQAWKISARPFGRAEWARCSQAQRVASVMIVIILLRLRRLRRFLAFGHVLDRSGMAG